MKKRIASLILAALTVCCTVFSMAVPSSAEFEEEEIQELTRDWGDKNVKTAADGNQYTFWETTDGRFSTMIGEDSVTWLYVEAVAGYDRQGMPVYESYWFGICNFIKMDGNRLFEKGSRFSVTFVSHKQNSEKWIGYWENLDPECRRNLIESSVMFCDISVTSPNGNEYKDLGDLTELFTSSNIMFFEDQYNQTPHVYKMLPVNGIDCPEPGRYVTFILNHLGDTFIAEAFDGYAGSTLADKITPASLIIIAAAALVLGLVVGFLIGKKKYSGIKKTAPNDEE